MKFFSRNLKVVMTNWAIVSVSEYIRGATIVFDICANKDYLQMDNLRGWIKKYSILHWKITLREYNEYGKGRIIIPLIKKRFPFDVK